MLLAWGNESVRNGAGLGAGDHRTNEHAERHADGSRVEGPHRLRVNVCRVLLTRGRDAAVIFVPPDSRLDATAAWLQGHGVIALGGSSLWSYACGGRARRAPPQGRVAGAQEHEELR